MSDDTERDAAMLRATSDGLILAINEIEVRERQKRGVPPADPGFTELARQVRVAAEVILELARKEEEIANATAAEPGVERLPPIETVGPGAHLGAILAEWRAVEQRLKAVPPGSPDAQDLVVEFDRLRRRYAAAVEAQRGGERGSR